MTDGGIGLKRLQHLVLWISDVERSVRFYVEVLGFEVKMRFPRAAFLRIPGSPDDHHLGLFEQAGVAPPHEGVARM
jgi:catechol 2,3-dioxygenase-like lactoylglutathione lyase family enzyme